MSTQPFQGTLNLQQGLWEAAAMTFKATASVIQVPLASSSPNQEKVHENYQLACG